MHGQLLGRGATLRAEVDLVGVGTAGGPAASEWPRLHPVEGARPAVDARVLRGRGAQQLVGAHAQRGAKGGNVVEGQAALAGLKAAEGRDIDVRALGDLLERQPPLRAQFPEPPTGADVDRLLEL